MEQATVKPAIDFEKYVTPTITKEQIEEIYSFGSEAVCIWGLLMAKKLAEAKGELAKGAPTPSMPSGAIPTYLKPTTKKRKHKPGQKPGHQGVHRESPQPDKTVELTMDRCPKCGGAVSKCRAKSTICHRIVEDIPENMQVEAIQYDSQRYWCPHCKEAFSPTVPDVLPNCTIGNRLLVLTAWLHYSNGNTLSQILDILNFLLKFKVTEGGLLQMWERLAVVLRPLYDQIHEDCLNSAVLHGDESGWRVDGKTHWIWCFSTQTETYYKIDESRGREPLQEFFKEFYDGVLISDFWGPYECVNSSGKQKCLVHLLREFEKVKKYKDTSGDWSAFSQKVKRLVRDAIRLWRYKRPDMPPDEYRHRCELINQRLDSIIQQPYENEEAIRLVKRLTKYRDALFYFLDRIDVPFENNHAERSIRPAVLMRKNSNGNRSDKGAETQAILMSIFRTLKQRNLPQTDTLLDILRNWKKTPKSEN